MSSWRLKLRLPTFKATVRTGASGSASDQTIEKGHRQDKLSRTKALPSLDQSDDLSSDHEVSGGDMFEMPYNDPGPTLHEIKQKANVAAWSKIRQHMRRAIVECSGMPPLHTCVLCTTDEAIYRCLQCSAWAFYCADCFGKTHSDHNIFHVGEVWQVY